MEEDNLKLFSVIVDNGSGVLFQPMNTEYTYILTANHIFKDEIDTEGRPKSYIEKIFNTPIEINRMLKNVGIWSSEKIIFNLKEGENYFPHAAADIAILKIPFIGGYEKIYAEEEFHINRDYQLCGFPNDKRISNLENLTNQYTSHGIANKTNSINNFIEVRLEQPKTVNNIIGMSGGGIFKLFENHISLIGIQSQMAKSISPNNEIDFVPISFFNEIITLNPDKLAPLLPPYMASFDFLRNKAFNINAGLDDTDISYTRMFLKEKTLEVINSDITPIYIKEYFKERLLLNEKNHSKLNDEIIYITWLEFITIINIAKEHVYQSSELENLFNNIRLIYKDTDTQWQDSEFLKECIICNFDGLVKGGTVLIKTNKLPARAKIEHYKLDRASVVPRIDYLKTEFENGSIADISIADATGDLKEFVFDKYNFMHFEYLKELMLIQNCEDYKDFKRSNQLDLLQKLKDEYGKLFEL